MNLTTDRIIHLIEKDKVPGDFAWESAIDSALGHHDQQDVIDSVRFLEFQEPRRTWSAQEFHGLMRNHLRGRWGSAAIAGHLFASEWHERLVAEAWEAQDTDARDRADRFLSRNTRDDDAAELYIRSIDGARIFQCASSVLVFTEMFDGKIIPKPPVMSS